MSSVATNLNSLLKDKYVDLSYDVYLIDADYFDKEMFLEIRILRHKILRSILSFEKNSEFLPRL